VADAAQRRRAFVLARTGMSITSQLSADGTTLQIRVGTRFDFPLFRPFRATQDKAGAARHVVVNLADTEYMDSSALGMLLLLREWAQRRGGEVTLLSPQPLVRKILSIANFERIFRIQ
jgi:anti-anti-sigma factor